MWRTLSTPDGRRVVGDAIAAELEAQVAEAFKYDADDPRFDAAAAAALSRDRAKSEDDAVGAPRLVLRRWDTTVVPRRVPPAPMRSKCPKGRGRVPRPTSQLEVLVGRAGDESVRQ